MECLSDIINRDKHKYGNVEDLEIELSTICNAKCPLCFRNYKAFSDKYPKTIVRDFDSLINQLNLFENLKVVRLVGSVSEPTKYPRFLDIIKYFKNRKIDIEICTNGDTNNSDFWKNLGILLDFNDKVYFTICGSTQELHSKYRVGTSLDRILKNAETLRLEKPIDYAQIIRFKYNSDDLDSKKFKKLVEPFSFKYYTESFYPKLPQNYKKSFDIELFKPAKKVKQYDLAYKLANSIPLKSMKCKCKSFINHWGQLDVYGNLYPCYLALEAQIPVNWNYENIQNFEFDCCRFCAVQVSKYCEANDIEYII